jgi:hypothetical protein
VEAHAVLGDAVDEGGVVDLEDEAGVDDGAVLLANGLGERPGVVLHGAVVGVADDLQGRRGDGRHEGFLGNPTPRPPPR